MARARHTLRQTRCHLPRRRDPQRRHRLDPTIIRHALGSVRDDGQGTTDAAPRLSLHATVVDVVGSEIVAGTLRENSTFNVEELRERFGVSRTVIRETLRSLQALGLVRARSKVGTQVNHSSSWALLNPAIIRWRAAAGYRDQMIELLQVRRGIEATAARLAAANMTDNEISRLVELSGMLATAAEANDGETFLDADTAFHRLLLEGSGNPVIAQFAEVVTAALRTRDYADQPLIIETTPLGLALHTQLAEAIASRDVELAERLATAIVDTTLSEFTLRPDPCESYRRERKPETRVVGYRAPVAG